ncbi:DNA polymerase/3'-5' exonuclease PolX [Deferribacter autotrophicus]|uniref:DNA-directed DNA polymerase n=1 Tax=Deferribacter autotrophicus TaxID=500465 RepID=A0A5A8F4W8_9BACT|nr:DNA polymerase/3'-5' exonuclease PolX [Deferribacter autotrophicus]KAA0259169.1 DNA polymerase/3'-5' exonuclease PolX [Deferribacter autotrophicus]
MNNSYIADLFEIYADYLELNNEDPFKVTAYRRGARVIRGLDFEIVDYVRNGGVLTDIKGVGKALSGKILEIIEKGSFDALEKIIQNTPEVLIEMTKIPGLGPKKAFRLYKELNIRSIGELEYACNENRLKLLKGFGLKTQEKILKGISFYNKHKDRYLFSEIEPIAEDLKNVVKGFKDVKRIEIAGSLRRKLETVKDIDVVVELKESNCIPHFIQYLSENEDINLEEKGDKKITFKYKGIHTDLRICDGDSFITMLHHLTGSKKHNEIIRMKGKEKGYKINEYGVFDGDKQIKIEKESDIYTLLDMPYVIPELREGFYEFERVVDEENLISLNDIRGVFHVHTSYSDGSMSIEDVIKVCLDRNYQYVGISDHSKSSYIANGLDEKRVFQQFEEIGELKEKYKEIKILKGIECDILADGSLDFDDEVLQRFDFVIAGVHSHFNLDKNSMTKRLVKALSNPYVNIFGHPTGRLLLSREGYTFDEDEVFKVCKENGVVIELNANPHRLDIDWRRMEYVHKYNLLISISPDAHYKEGFDDLRFGVYVARKGCIIKEQVLNTKSFDEIAEKLRL